MMFRIHRRSVSLLMEQHVASAEKLANEAAMKWADVWQAQIA
jgi:hypothetical protein